MKGKLYSLIVLALILVVSVALVFVLDMNSKITNPDGLAVYWTSKVIGIALLVVVGLLLTLRKSNGSMPFMMCGIATIYQFLPLGVRFMVLNSDNVVFAWVLTLIVSVVFIGLTLVFEYISSKDSAEEE